MTEERSSLLHALRLIAENAESWHGDDAAKGRALAVIATQAREAIEQAETPNIGETVFQWLIERGQPERQEPTVWLEHTAWHPATEGRWTENANDAAMFPTREAAEEYISETLTHPARGASARAVEHGFMTRGDA